MYPILLGRHGCGKRIDFDARLKLLDSEKPISTYSKSVKCMILSALAGKCEVDEITFCNGIRHDPKAFGSLQIIHTFNNLQEIIDTKNAMRNMYDMLYLYIIT